MSNTVHKKLDKKDHLHTALRWTFIGSNTVNFGTLQGAGYAWAIADILRKLYPNDEDYKKAMEVEFEYFNTTPYMAPAVLGADVAIQEREGLKSLNAVRSVKTSLMGPLAGMGDSILWVLFPTIMGSIAGYMALEGNPLGALVWIALNMLLVLFRIKLYDLGYKSGVRLITDLASQLQLFTEAASIIGLTVVGSMIAGSVKVYTPFVFTLKEVTIGLQAEIFDKIVPGLLSIILVGLVYWLMEKKKVGFLKMILLLLVISLVGAYFGILGVKP
ncbi:PTS system mannose/fructose/sorbose family transporter subunit IID [Streptococcus marmotae]|uniref:PTS system mannose/fructose/sorbose family transporter subunit IID n=1 Tax=Streptococcus marmotae TaxID=1825069 RepID=UPI000836EE9E|nr:PTS system mannose/fructose/sorbose family transporter subunit IID [Streptococcus marmotae]